MQRLFHLIIKLQQNKDTNKKKPPIIVFVDGTSLIPKIGNQTQNIPPTTSVKDNKVNSAAGIAFEPIEYKINPEQTKNPCSENNELLQLVAKNACPVDKIIIDANTKQKKPAKATVVNLGVSFLHLSETEKTEKPIEEVSPNTKPIKDFSPVLPIAIINIPAEAIMIDIQTLSEIRSLRNKNAKSAVKKGIAAKQSKVTAALVFVIE